MTLTFSPSTTQKSSGVTIDTTNATTSMITGNVFQHASGVIGTNAARSANQQVNNVVVQH